MKIINKDNFDREYKDDHLVADNVPAFYAEFIAQALNDRFSGEHSPNFYQAKPDDYVLFKFEP